MIAVMRSYKSPFIYVNIYRKKIVVLSLMRISINIRPMTNMIKNDMILMEVNKNGENRRIDK
jgi:hypothetical protein